MKRPLPSLASTAALSAVLLAASTLASLPAGSAHAQRQQARPPQGQAAPSEPRAGESILAVVNGDVISRTDVDSRGRLFSLSTGIPINPETVARLRPQILKQLIDERLRLQEVQRRKILVGDKEIAEAIADIEARNGMPPGMLRAQLTAGGSGYRTLIDQIRVQIGWGRVIRQELGSRAQVSDADVADQLRVLKAETGQTEYRVAEIFVPIDDPAKATEAQRFADVVIGQLRAGAPFPVVAAQFSQSQTALQGGDLGWVRLNQLDPEVAPIVREMPAGAVSNPVRVPGGIVIASLRGKRELGRDLQNVLRLRQVFLPFEGALNPQAPTEQQKRALEVATGISRGARSCEAMEAAAKQNNSSRPPDPGEVRLEGIGSPQLRQLLAGLPLNQASRPIVSPDGIAVVMVCSREQKNMGEPSKEEVTNQLLQNRIEQASRQLVRDLRRRAVLDERA